MLVPEVFTYYLLFLLLPPPKVDEKTHKMVSNSNSIKFLPIPSSYTSATLAVEPGLEPKSSGSKSYVPQAWLVERSKQCWSWPSDYIYMPLSSCQILFSHPKPKLLQLNSRRAWILRITLVGSYSLLPDETVSS